ncbi:DUF4190 domain-containing protein [Nocardia inohanensis]|uniref:DUF4190 domain-containing protein n=1 Tax=Nocardia inohanensis TaxID=209246 RepID=UPI00082EFAA0|nr:DUF4190 domain-containing protein [Nocardia inohanensis]
MTTPHPTAPRNLNILALTTLITGFIGFCCLPLLLGPLALLQIRDTGERGRGLAITGMLTTLAWLTGLTLIT